MPEYEIVYFLNRGRAECARLMLSYAGIPFKDTRLTPETWGSVKGDRKLYPFGQLPVFYTDGEPLSESSAINRHVARLTNLDGVDNKDKAEVDQAYELLTSWYNAVFPYFLAAMGFSDGDKDKLKQDIFVPQSEVHLPRIVSVLKPSGFFGRTGPTYADFFAANIIETFKSLSPDIIDKFPQLTVHMNKVYSLPPLQKYMKERPQRPC